jgi:hypothetical protein
MSEVKTVSIGPSSPTAPSEAPAAPPVDETPIEAPEVPEAQPEPKEDSRMSERFAALARQEERNRAERLSMKEDQEKFSEYNKLKESVSSNPMAALEHLGIDLDALIMASLGGDAPQEEIDPLSKLQQDFESYKDQQIREREEVKAAQESAQQESLDQAVESHKQSIVQELQDNSDKYELIALNNANDLVWEVTEAHYNEHGEVLTPSQAADLVEAHLDEQFQKMVNSRKVKEPIEEIEAPEQNKIISSKTLTSAMSSNTPQVQVSNKPVTMEESKRRAAALLKWT